MARGDAAVREMGLAEGLAFRHGLNGGQRPTQDWPLVRGHGTSLGVTDIEEDRLAIPEETMKRVSHVDAISR